MACMLICITGWPCVLPPRDGIITLPWPPRTYYLGYWSPSELRRTYYLVTWELESSFLPNLGVLGSWHFLSTTMVADIGSEYKFGLVWKTLKCQKDLSHYKESEIELFWSSGFMRRNRNVLLQGAG